MRSTSILRLISVFSVFTLFAFAGCGPRQVVVGTDTSPSQPSGDMANEDFIVEELTRLSDAQESYFSSKNRFADSLERLEFTPRGGIRVDLLQGDQGGYSAIASLGGSECGVFSGSVRSPRSYVTRAGTPACRP